jgi:hypothetical protein
MLAIERVAFHGTSIGEGRHNLKRPRAARGFLLDADGLVPCIMGSFLHTRNQRSLHVLRSRDGRTHIV